MINKAAIFSTPLIALIFSVAAETAIAESGAFEINQACVAEGCFPGDDPGFPITIHQSGNYFLTSKLAISTPDISAIEVQAEDVTVDLKEHLIQGVNVCDKVNQTCPLPSRSFGIAAGSSARGITVRNGKIDGFGESCVFIGPAGFATNLKVSNCWTGLRLEPAASATRIRAVFNHSGVTINSQATLEHSTVSENFSRGILVSGTPAAATINHCSITSNARSGIILNAPAHLLNSTISNNGSEGVWVLDDAPGATGNGSSGSMLVSNLIIGNQSAGLRTDDSIGPPVIIGGNTFTGNATGDAASQIGGVGISNVVEILPNVCATTTECL